MLRYAVGLPTIDVDDSAGVGDAARYGPTLGPTVRTEAELARFLRELMRAESLDPERVAQAVWIAAQQTGTLGGMTREQAHDAIDAHLSTTALQSDPTRCAIDLLRALGLTQKAARALMATAPPSPSAPRAPRPAPVPTPASPPATPPDVQPADAPRLHRAALALTAALAKDAWMRELAAGSAADVKAALRARWESVPVWLEPLRARLLGGRIEGFAGDAKRAFLEIRAHDGVQLHYVASPTPAAEVKRALAAIGLGTTSPLYALALHFDRLWELSPIGIASGFVPVTEWVSVAAARRRKGSVFSAFDRDELDGWLDAIVVRVDENDRWIVVSPSTGAVALVSPGILEVAGATVERFFRGA